MTKKLKRKNKRIYLRYIDDELGDITLTFASERSLQRHINRKKIDKSKILHMSEKRPQYYENYPSASKILSTLYYCEQIKP